jgi:ABC-type multidrug transport system fused ATPase/permease subunit
MQKASTLSPDKKKMVFDLSSDKKLKSFANKLDDSTTRINKIEAYLALALPKNLEEVKNQAPLVATEALSKIDAINEKYKARVEMLNKLAIICTIVFVLLFPLVMLALLFITAVSEITLDLLQKYQQERDQALDEVNAHYENTYSALLKKFEGEFKLEAEFFGQPRESLNQAHQEILSSLKLIDSLSVEESKALNEHNEKQESLMKNLNEYNRTIEDLSEQIAEMSKLRTLFALRSDHILRLDNLKLEREKIVRRLADRTSKDKFVNAQKLAKSAEAQLLSGLGKRTKVLYELLEKEKENHQNAPIVQLITHYRIDKKTAILHEPLRRKKDSRHNTFTAQPITNSVYTGLDLTPKRSKWMAFYGRNNCQAKAIAYNSSNNRQNREKTIKNCPGL